MSLFLWKRVPFERRKAVSETDWVAEGHRERLLIPSDWCRHSTTLNRTGFRGPTDPLVPVDMHKEGG